MPLWEEQSLSSLQQKLLDAIAELMFKLLSQIAEEEYSSVLSISKRKSIFEDIKQKVSNEQLGMLHNIMPDLF